MTLCELLQLTPARLIVGEFRPNVEPPHPPTSIRPTLKNASHGHRL